VVAPVITLHRSGRAEPYRKQVPETVELIQSSSAKVLSGWSFCPPGPRSLQACTEQDL